MGKFNVGDRVRLVKDDATWAISNMEKEGVVLRIKAMSGFIEVKFDNSENECYEVDYGDPRALELVEKVEKHPEEITHNGVKYIRKPEPEHVWKFGDWARVKQENIHGGKIVFVTGRLKETGFVPVVDGRDSTYPLQGVRAELLEYISSATIPE